VRLNDECQRRARESWASEFTRQPFTRHAREFDDASATASPVYNGWRQTFQRRPLSPSKIAYAVARHAACRLREWISGYRFRLRSLPAHAAAEGALVLEKSTPNRTSRARRGTSYASQPNQTAKWCRPSSQSCVTIMQLLRSARWQAGERGRRSPPGRSPGARPLHGIPTPDDGRCCRGIRRRTMSAARNVWFVRCLSRRHGGCCSW